MTFLIIIVMVLLAILMVFIRKYDLVIWPIWVGCVGYCLYLIKEIEKTANHEMGLHPGQAISLVIVATVLYLLFAGAIGRVLRKFFKQNRVWQNLALVLSVLLLLLPFFGVAYLEATT